MPNPLESARQNVQQEAADELMLIQAHHLLARLVTVVLPAETDLTLRKVDQTIVGDGHQVRVKTEMLKHMRGSAKRWLGIDHPLGASCGHHLPKPKV
jgi:hypothetical protein